MPAFRNAQPGDFVKYGPSRFDNGFIQGDGSIITTGIVRVSLEQAIMSIPYGWKSHDLRMLASLSGLEFVCTMKRG